MNAIDQEILNALQGLSKADKEQVLAFIQALKPASSPDSDLVEKAKAVSEDTGEYYTPAKLISHFKSLPQKLQRDLIHYLNQLKAQADKEKTDPGKKKPHPKFKPGFGGAKGLFKKLPDDLDQYSAAEDFEDYL